MGQKIYLLTRLINTSHQVTHKMTCKQKLALFESFEWKSQT